MKLYLLLLFFIANNSISNEYVELIAHRANFNHPIENSLDAIQGAWLGNVDAIELDVRVSVDGVVYLYHDDEIKQQKLDLLTFSEIRQLTTEIKTPTLGSVFSLGEPRGFYLLDLKSTNPAAIDSLILSVKLSDINLSKVVFQSRKLDVLQKIRHELSSSKYFFLTSLERDPPFFLAPKASDIVEQVSGSEIDGISIKGRQFLDHGYVSTLRNTGLSVYVWTINDLERIRYYQSIGVDGIITDEFKKIKESESID